MYPASLRGHPPPRTESGIQVVTDSHNSGQHKDREAAAAEVRRMWQPTPSWTQPDPTTPPPPPVPHPPAQDSPSKPPVSSQATPDPEEVEEEAVEEEKQDALSQEFPGDSWYQPA